MAPAWISLIWNQFKIIILCPYFGSSSVIDLYTIYNNYFRAIKKFTAAIKADPTYVKAYVCRSDAYGKIHDVSYQDWTFPYHVKYLV